MKLLIDRLALIYEENPDLEGDRGQIDLIKYSGASKSVVNQWLAGKIKSLAIEYALELEKHLGYSHIWLMTGKGEKQIPNGFSVEAMEVAARFDRLGAEQKTGIMNMIDLIAPKTEPEPKRANGF